MEKISCSNLSFYYGKKIIFKDVNIKIDRPGIYALIGENGTGKTTFLKLILGLLPAKGINHPDRKEISFSLGINAYNGYLTVKEELISFCLIKNINFKKIKEVMYMCQIMEYENIKMKHLSFGNIQKVLLAKTLLFDSSIYIYDEPLNGLDPKAIINFRKILCYLKEQGKIVIVSSHILKELNEVADYIIFIKNNALQMFLKDEIKNMEDLFYD